MIVGLIVADALAFCADPEIHLKNPEALPFGPRAHAFVQVADRSDAGQLVFVLGTAFAAANARIFPSLGGGALVELWPDGPADLSQELTLAYLGSARLGGAWTITSTATPGRPPRLVTARLGYEPFAADPYGECPRYPRVVNARVEATGDLRGAVVLLELAGCGAVAGALSSFGESPGLNATLDVSSLCPPAWDGLREHEATLTIVDAIGRRSKSIPVTVPATPP